MSRVELNGLLVRFYVPIFSSYNNKPCVGHERLCVSLRVWNCGILVMERENAKEKTKQLSVFLHHPLCHVRWALCCKQNIFFMQQNANNATFISFIRWLWYRCVWIKKLQCHSEHSRNLENFRWIYIVWV